MAHVAEQKHKSKPGQNQKNNNNNAGSNKQVAVIVPPDGGWGWMVVFASFMVHVITDGVTYSCGLFYTEFVNYFESTQQAASWIVSLLVGITYCSGPFSSFLVHKFGCQWVTIAGTILSSACLLASVWANSIVTLYFTIGIGTGLGFGLIYLPAIVSVTVYFEKYRSLATGIAVCGSGLGTVIFAEAISQLIKFYGGYKQPMMILSAVVLNCIAFGIMFRPLEPVKSAECIPLKEVTKNGGSAHLHIQQQQQQQQQQQAPSNDATRINKQAEEARRSSISHDSPKKLCLNAHETPEKSSNNIRLAMSQPILLAKDANHHHQSPITDVFQRAHYASGIMSRSDVFLRSSIRSIRKRSESLTNGSEENMRLRLSLRSLPNGAGHGHRVLELSDAKDLDSDETNIIKKMLQLSLMKDPLFIIFTVSNFCTSIGFNVPYVYLVSQATSKGMDKIAAGRLLAVIGIANAVGRIVLGYISDKPGINRLLIYNLCLTICGLATACSPICNSFWSFAVYASIFGFTAGAYVGLTSVCLVDLVGLERLTNAFGLLLLFQGIASFLGPPIAGLLADNLHSYDPGFYVAGTMIAISGIMLFVIPPIQRRINKKNERLQNLHELS